jgi:hypothetical protein
MRNLSCLALIVLLLPGCLLSRRTQNDPLPAENVAQLVPGRTSAKEAVAVLGAPTEVVQLGKRTAYRYDHAETKDAGLVLILINHFNSDTRADRVWVFFDENDVLTHVAASLHAKDASWAMPWQSVRAK